jgi:hypothetical protein
MSKTHLDWLELTDYSANPSDTDTSRAGLSVVSGSLMLWDGSTWSAVSSGGSGGVSTWDGLYGLDKHLTIDDDSLTFTLTHATNDGLTLAANSGKTALVYNTTTPTESGFYESNGTVWSPVGYVLQKTGSDYKISSNLDLSSNFTNFATLPFQAEALHRK